MSRIRRTPKQLLTELCLAGDPPALNYGPFLGSFLFWYVSSPAARETPLSETSSLVLRWGFQDVMHSPPELRVEYPVDDSVVSTVYRMMVCAARPEVLRWIFYREVSDVISMIHPKQQASVVEAMRTHFQVWRNSNDIF